MSLDRVIEGILQRGQRESQEITESANQEVERMLSDVRSKGEELLKERERQAEEQASREMLRETARAELESKKIALQAQKEVLDEVLVRTKQRLKDLRSREDLLKILVERHRKEIADGFVLCNQADLPLLKKLTDGEVRGDIECVGGFIVESKDGSRRIDLTYEAFLEDIWEDLIREVADLFWKEG